MNNLRRRILLVVAAFGSVLVMGTLGFMLVERVAHIDAFYMTLITVTTIGYGEIFPLSTAGRIYNSLLILVGVTAILLATGMMTQTVIELELNNFFRKRRQKKMIDKLNEHVIVCGFGRVGRGASEELERLGIAFVIVDKNEDRVEQAMHQGLLAVAADASRDETLTELGVARARGLIATLGTDADNLFLTMTAKTLNPNLRLSVRVDEESAEAKMKRAGADHVFAPYNSTGHRMAQALVKPHVMQFVEFTTGKATGLALEIEQVRVDPTCKYHDKTVADIQVETYTQVIILAIRKTHGQMTFNPPSEFKVEGGDHLIAVGERDGLKKLAQMLAPKTGA